MYSIILLFLATPDIPLLGTEDDDAKDDEPHGLHAGKYCASVVFTSLFYNKEMKGFAQE